VYYRWPCLTSDGSQRYARMDRVDVRAHVHDAAFSDHAVNELGRGSTVRQWHHAIGLFNQRQGVVPGARGGGRQVIFSGWDWWSGNTIVISHDVGGVHDAFRTIYMHLRMGQSTMRIKRGMLTVPKPQRPGPDVSTSITSPNTGCPHGGPYNANASSGERMRIKIDR